MDLSLPISYNSLSINTATRSAGGNPTSGYIVEQFRPIPPPIDSYFEKRALTDGMDAGDVFLAGRQFGLIVSAFGTTKADLWDKTQDLLAAFSPTIAYATDTANVGFLAFDFTQPTADIVTWPTSAFPNGIPMRYYVRPMHSPIYLVERDKDGGTASRGFSKRFEIALQARDPRKYLQSTIASAITTATQTATYRGDYPTQPVLTWSMTAAGSSAFAVVINTATVQINLSAQTSGSFELDFGLGTFEKGTTSMWGLVTIAGFFPIEAGSTFRFANPTGLAGGTATLTYREAFS